MNLIETREGKVSIFTPDPKYYGKEGKFDPSWAPVFYNPRMKLNRDLSVLVLSVIRPKSIVDALSATGIRGIRYFIEVGSVERLILNDRNSVAVTLIKENLKKNNVNGEVTNKDANALLYEIKAEYVDIDPFGSPSPFMLSAINSTINKGYVAFTATDLSALECSSKSSARRKYDLTCERLSFSKELGIRGLIAKVIREASIVEKAAYPIFSFYYDYYYRVFFRIENGAKKADQLLKMQKYYYECSNCGYRETSDFFEKKECPKCKNDMKVYGPAWTGELGDKNVILKLRENMKSFEYLESYKILSKMIEIISNEVKYSAPYYRLDFLASKIKSNIPKKENILRCLEDGSPTHFDYRGIKSNKEIDDITLCIKKLTS